MTLDDNSQVKAFTASEFIRSCKSDPHLIGGHIKIWGDHKKRGLSSLQRFKRIARTDSGILFEFTSGARLEVTAPADIQVSSAFIKIQTATSIQWDWPQHDIHAFYKLVNDQVELTSNDQSNAYDALSYHPALFIYS